MKIHVNLLRTAAFIAGLSLSISAHAIVGAPNIFTNNIVIDDSQDRGCPSDCNGNPTSLNTWWSTGIIKPIRSLAMPRYWVTEPYINLWIADTPATYTTSLGQDMDITVTYCQRDARPSARTLTYTNLLWYGHLPKVPTTGWNHNWFSYIHVDATNQFLYLPGGGVQCLSANTNTLIPNNEQVIPTSAGLRLVHSDGSSDVFEQATANYAANCYDLLWTEHIDPYGNIIRLSYSTTTTNAEHVDQYLLRTVMDYDTNTITFNYDTNNYLQTVTMPYGKSASLVYDTNGCLTSITDAAQLTTTFTSTRRWVYFRETDKSMLVYNISAMYTPYGVASFWYDGTDIAQVSTNGTELNRSIRISHGSGTDEKYEFHLRTYYPSYMEHGAHLTDGALNLDIGVPITPTDLNFTSSDSGGNDEIDDSFMRNSYHWKPGANFDNLNEAAVTHWLLTADGSQISNCRSITQEPGYQDGSPGPVVWYNYTGKSNPCRMPESGAKTIYTSWQMAGYGSRAGWTASQMDDFGNLVSTAEAYDNDVFNIGGFYSTSTKARTNVYTYAYITNYVNGNPCIVSRVQAVATPAATNQTSVIYATKTVNDGTNILVFQCPQTVSTWNDLATNTVTFNGLQQVSNTISPIGITNTYVYGTDCRLQSVVTPGLTPGSMTWSNGRVSSVTSPGGVTTSYTYDNLDRVTLVYDNTAGKLVVSNTYDRLDLVQSVDVMGNQINASYDYLDRLVSVTGPLTQAPDGSQVRYTTSYGYCPCGTLTSITDPNNNQTIYTVDPGSRITAKTEVNAQNSQPLVTSYFFDPRGRSCGTILPTGQSFKTDLNIQGLPVVNYVSDQRYSPSTPNYSWTKTASYQYDDLDQLTNAIDYSLNLTRVLNVSYDAYGRVTNSTLNGTNLGSYFYTGLFLYNTTDAQGNAYTYQYDNLGRNYRVSTPQNLISVLTPYNALGQVTLRSDGAGNISHYYYDAYGVVTQMTSTASAPMNYAYDDLHRLTNVIAQGSSQPAMTLSYTALGQLASRSSWIPTSGGQVKNTAKFWYDGLGRKAVLKDYGNDTSLYHTATFNYQDFGAFSGALANETSSIGLGSALLASNLDAYTMGVNYAYDAYGRLSLISANNSYGTAYSSGYDYDRMSRLTTVTNDGGTVSFNYSGILSPLTNINYPGTVATAFTYTGLGQIQSIKTGIGFLGNYSGNSYFATTLDAYNYTYDSLGRRQTLTKPGSYTYYGYDPLGQLTSATAFNGNDNTPRLNETFIYGYDKAGNITNVTFGAGAASAFKKTSFGQANRIASMPQADLKLLAGNLDKMMDSLTVAVTGGGIQSSNSIAPYADGTWSAVISTQTNGTYANPVTVTVGGCVISNGTLTLASSSQFTVANPGGTPAYSTNSIRHDLTNTPSASLVYDSLGNLVSDGPHTYIYDGLNRLRVLIGSDGSISRLNYAGNRVIQEVNTKPYSDYATVNYSYGNGLLSRSDISGTAYYHIDGNGNVVDMTDTNGAVVAHYVYEPFGQIVAQSGRLADINLYRFSGERYISGVNLYYYGVRFYSPDLRRWLNEDPIGYLGGRNLYGFCGNDPVNNVDVLGLSVECEQAVENYFTENGISSNMWEKNGNVYKARQDYVGKVPTSGSGGVLWDMLKTTRPFKAMNLKVSELKLQVKARENTLTATESPLWNVGSAAGWNPQFWENSGGMVKFDAARGINDMFAHPETYTTGCKMTSRILLLKGILETIGSEVFNNAIGTGAFIDSRAAGAHLLKKDDTAPIYQKNGTPSDWVRGDVGYVQGKNPDHLLTGEWIVYKGGGVWWGFDDPPDERTLDGWIDKVSRWPGADPNFEPFVDKVRISPGVGLDFK